MKSVQSIVLRLLVLLATGAIDVNAEEQIMPSAAISLQNVFEDIAVLYEKQHQEITVLSNYEGFLRPMSGEKRSFRPAGNMPILT